MSDDTNSNVVVFNKAVREETLPAEIQDGSERVKNLGTLLIPFLQMEEPDVAIGTLISLLTAINIELPEYFGATCEALEVVFLQEMENYYPELMDMDE